MDTVKREEREEETEVSLERRLKRERRHSLPRLSQATPIPPVSRGGGVVWFSYLDSLLGP